MSGVNTIKIEKKKVHIFEEISDSRMSSTDVFYYVSYRDLSWCPLSTYA